MVACTRQPLLGWVLVAMDLAVFLGTVVAALVVLVVLKRDLSQDTASASKAVRAGHPPGSTQIVPTGGSAGRVASGGDRMSRLPAPASRQRAVHANAVDEVKLQTPPTPPPKPRLETRPKPGTETRPKPGTETKPKTAASGETKADVTQTGVPTPPGLDDDVMLVQVTVPHGIDHGKMFGVILADGRTIHTKVPKHGKPGDVISVPVRSAASSHVDL